MPLVSIMSMHMRIGAGILTPSLQPNEATLFSRKLPKKMSRPHFELSWRSFKEKKNSIFYSKQFPLYI
jgi:hypothetical protein